MESPAIGQLEASLLGVVQRAYELLGWPGIVLLMAIESAAIPLPSEVIMPLAGWFLIRSHNLPLWWLVVAAALGALGNTIGSWLTYWIGAMGGRPLLERYGRYVLITKGDLERADRWFERYGSAAVFVGRLMPVVRTFISLPAGVARTDLRAFSALTFLGSFIWSLLLVSAGYVLGEHYLQIRQSVSKFDVPIVVALVLLLILYGYRHTQRGQHQS